MRRKKSPGWGDEEVERRSGPDVEETRVCRALARKEGNL